MRWLIGSPNLLSLGMPGGFEWIIILGFGLLIFGKRLPEFGRSLSKGIIEFKNGLKGVEDGRREALERRVASRRKADDESSPGPPLWLILAMAGAVVCAWWVTRSR